jgi:hypothetical protein
VDDTVMEPPRETAEPLMVMLLFCRSVFCTVAQVATPLPFIDLMNWLVQEVPVYAVTWPIELARWSAEVTPVTVRLVVVAVPETVRPPAAVPLPMVVEA